MAQKNNTLVIDDDEVFCKTLCRVLKRHGLSPLYAANSSQALMLANEQKPEFVVLDLRLDQDSGLNLIQPLLQINQDMKIVVLTGFASITTAVQAIKLGAINYLPKPVNSLSIIKAFKDTDKVVQSSVFSPTPLKQLEWEHIQRVLDENDGNISITARQLNMHRRTLQRKLKKRPQTS